MTMNDQPKATSSAPVRPSAGTPTARAHAVWKGALLFESGVGERLQQIDGNSKSAPSPVETLLSAIGTCAGADVADILTKQRTPPDSMEIEIFAMRRPEHPRRIQTLELTFTLTGARIEAPQLERAIALSIEKYCTVAASLAGDIVFTTMIVLNGARGQPVRQPMFSASVPPR